MRTTKARVRLIIVAGALSAAYLLFSFLRAPTLEFRDRTFPPGFRSLVLPSVSQFDPAFALQQIPHSSARVKQDAHEVCDALFRDPLSPTFGSADAQVQLVAFFDYRCPYCKTLSNIIRKLQATNLRIVFKEWPILGGSSVLAARAGLAAHKQGKYLAFHTRLMNSRLIPTVEYITEIASEFGMNLEQHQEDISSDATSAAIQRTSTLASTLGFIGTPALVVGRTIVQGEITHRQLEHLIKQEKRQPASKIC